MKLCLQAMITAAGMGQINQVSSSFWTLVRK